MSQNILPSIPAGGLQAAEVHALVRGKPEFEIVQANNQWAIALEHWSGNNPKTPWRAHLFDAGSGKWRGVIIHSAPTAKQAYNDALKAMAAKTNHRNKTT